MLEIKTLGGLSLRVSGEALRDMGSRKAEALLVYLAVEGGRHNRGVLATLLWPESNQVRASTSLRVALSTLREHVGDHLDITRDTVGIESEAEVCVDVSDLERALASGDLEKALQIHRGVFLKGFHVRGSAEFEDWVRCEQERVTRLVAGTLHESVSREIEAGDYGRGLKLVRRLLELDPLDERAHQQSMLLLALSDQRSAALAQYETCCDVLQAELGVGPSQETRELYEQISRGEAAKSLRPVIPVHNLPASQTSFIGRERELTQVGELIRDPACRLVTLTGPGGSGKTRLALQAATKALRAFPDGVFFVPLESVASADYLIPAITKALRFNVDTFATRLDQKTQLLHYLKDRSVLLVMDGFERLVDGAGLLSQVLEHAPRVQMLVTSRQRLDLRGEWTLALGGLSFPDELQDTALDDWEAVRLFTERAQQARTGLRLARLDGVEVIRVCQLVEGMPLGIELAAAQTSLLSPMEVAAEMEESLDFLSTSARDIPARHKSLRAAFDSSWQLLTDEQRETFCKLSAFRGGFDRKAALQVAGAGLPELSALLNKSLLKRNAVETFTMHALLREFAAEKLSERAALEEDVQERHCRYYVDLLTERAEDAMGAGMLRARDDFRRNGEDICAAVMWASVHWETPSVRRVLVALLSAYVVHDWHEGADVFRDIARRRREAVMVGDRSDPSHDPVVLSARAHQAFLLTNLGRVDKSEAISRECVGPLDELGLKEELSECLHNLGVNASFRGDYDEARELLEEAILHGRACGHSMWPTYLLWLGHAYFLLGEYERGLLSLQKCRELFERGGTSWGVAFALSKMGLAADGLGDHAGAIARHQEALSIFEQLDNEAGRGYSLSRMSMSATFLKDYAQAVRLGEEGYQVFEEIGHRWGMCTSLCGLGFARLGLGEIESAKEHFRKAFEEARRDEMAPLSLYALAGLACTLAEERKRRAALKVFRYVQQRPEIPALYLAMAREWIGETDVGFARRSTAVSGVDYRAETMDELIERLLGHR